jgi:uncharacterized oxidoreductase
MKTTHNTVLVTGGSAGIGFEIARSFSKLGNQVIIIGRNSERLRNAASQLPGVTAIAADVSKESEVQALVERLGNDFPDLNIVINNAGQAWVYNLVTPDANAFDKAADEMLTNYLSVIRLNERLLPSLKLQKNAAIVNVSSVVAFVPGSLATYSASKAALHSYTQALRIALADVSDIKVFELMPPLVNTDFSAPIGGSSGFPPSVVAEALLSGFAKDEYEIRVGQTEEIYKLYLSSPTEALKFLNAHRKQVKA